MQTITESTKVMDFCNNNKKLHAFHDTIANSFCSFCLLRFAHSLYSRFESCLLHCNSIRPVNEMGYNEHETQLSVCYEVVKRDSCGIWISSFSFLSRRNYQNAAFNGNYSQSFPQILNYQHLKAHAIYIIYSLSIIKYIYIFP